MRVPVLSHQRSFRSYCTSHRVHEDFFAQAVALSSFGIVMGCVVPTRMNGFNRDIMDGIHMEETNGFTE